MTTRETVGYRYLSGSFHTDTAFVLVLSAIFPLFLSSVFTESLFILVLAIDRPGSSEAVAWSIETSKEATTDA
jgi:hypothetical protein